MMKVVLGSQKSIVLIRMDFWGWAQVSSAICDMYWRLFNMYWESSGFGLCRLYIGGAGVVVGGRD